MKRIIISFVLCLPVVLQAGKTEEVLQAAAQGKVKSIALFTAPEDFLVQDENNKTPLQLAVLNNHDKFVKDLCRKSIDINKKSDKPLELFAQLINQKFDKTEENIEAIKVLDFMKNVLSGSEKITHLDSAMVAHCASLAIIYEISFWQAYAKMSDGYSN